MIENQVHEEEVIEAKEVRVLIPIQPRKSTSLGFQVKHESQIYEELLIATVELLASTSSITDVLHLLSTLQLAKLWMLLKTCMVAL